jgi:hypothetical protein
MPAPPPLDPDVGRYNEVPRPTDGRLDPVLRMLKGGDARIRTVSERVGLATRVSGETYHLLTGRDVLNTERVYDDDAQMADIVERTGVLLQRGTARARGRGGAECALTWVRDGRL